MRRCYGLHSPWSDRSPKEREAVSEVKETPGRSRAKLAKQLNIVGTAVAIAITTGLAIVALIIAANMAQASSAIPPPYPTDAPNVPALGFESDLDEDGRVEVCPGGVKVTLVDNAIADINETTATLPGGDPHFVRVTSPDAWCEVVAVNKGGPNADYLARIA